MKFDLNRNQCQLELRVLELEDSVALMSRVIGTITEMLGGLNRIAAHYADTVQSMLPVPVPRGVWPPADRVNAEPGAGGICPGDPPCDD